MQTIKVTIRGDASLLQHRFGETAQVDSKGGTRAVHIRDDDPRAQAEAVSYRTPSGQLYHPAASIGMSVF